MAWLGGALLIMALAYVGVVAFYWIFQERFIFLRLDAAPRKRYRFGGYRECWLERPDGARLHALWFKARESRGAVLYFHGHSGNVRRWGRIAARFTSLGHDVLMPDPRGYGKSSGRMSERALIEDALAWFDWLAAQEGTERITLYGRSLGSALATPVATERAARMLLLETPFNNLIDVCWSQAPLLPYRWLLRYPFRNDETVSGVRCPTYIFHGRRDQVVPYTSALKLYAAIPPTVQRELFTFPRASHHDLYRFARFRTVLKRLLQG